MEEIGFAAYLVKPTRQSDLFDSLSTVLADTAPATPAQHIVTRHVIRELRRSAVRILLAEDNVTNQLVALGILKKLGLRADPVTDGAEAVRALEQVPYDLVLMDVQMPEVDGLEATRRIRDPRSAVLYHGIPIIAMTAHAMQGDREQCLAAGMDDYLSKPISPEALAAALDRWLPRDDAVIAPQVMSAAALVRDWASPPDAASPAFDRAGFIARLLDDEDLARAVATGFLDDIPGQIAALRASLEVGDEDAALRQSHSIKGASANVGGEAVREAAAEVERAVREGDLAGAASLIPILESRFRSLQGAMREFVGDVGPGQGAQA
jgi:CheY-like chemotaxis protein/HPt (histidine-containing phosphotransfer) domain-containing protein